MILKDIMNEPEEITGLKGNTIPRRLSVRYISFSAHVDYSQNSEFIDLIGAQHIVSTIPEYPSVFILRLLLGTSTWRANCYGPFTSRAAS
jgi:cleavage and polyadenylation specificity factor subunit 3